MSVHPAYPPAPLSTPQLQRQIQHHSPPVSVLIPILSLEDGLLFCGYHQPVLNSMEAPLSPLSQTTRNFIRQQQLLLHPGSREEEVRCSKTSDLGTALGMIMWSHLNGSQFNVWQDENSGDSFHFPKIYLFFGDTFMVCFSIIKSDMLLIRL